MCLDESAADCFMCESIKYSRMRLEIKIPSRHSDWAIHCSPTNHKAAVQPSLVRPKVLRSNFAMTGSAFSDLYAKTKRITSSQESRHRVV